MYQIHKLMERELFCTLRFQTFFCHKTTSQSHHGCNYTKNCTYHSILMCICTTHHLLQIGERKQCDESHCISSYHTERRKLVCLIVIIGHHTQQGTIRHIHHSIYRHHQKIQSICIDSFTHRSEVWSIE